MTFIQKILAQNVIRKVAKQQGITYNRCYSDMVDCIEVAWATTDPAIKNRQIELVGEERVPTPEEFIVLASSAL